MSEPLTQTSQLTARHLSRHFDVRVPGRVLRAKRVVHAVDDVSLDLVSGRVISLVGESGSGKSVLARMLARIVTPSAGEIVMNGVSVPLAAKRTLDYASQVQLVLQDPFASMNPVHRIRHNLARPLLIHGTHKDQVDELAASALRRVALDPPERYLDRYPHELSGGQLQRVSIARALCVEPKVLLADEPISMLDVSVRLGVLNLLRALCDNEHLAILYITHDIASARYIAEEIIVMYAGQIVEHAPSVELVDHATHPYTKLLLASVPDPANLAPGRASLEARRLEGAPASGCRFAPRCPQAMDICRVQTPPQFVVGVQHTSRCWLHRDAPEAVFEVTSLARREKGDTENT